MAFKGIVVVDCTHVLAGPFCTYALALLGADVIKIESPDRPDCARGRGPNAELNAAGMGLTYQVQASGKKSLALDLRSDEGKRIFFLLLLKADVLVVNYLHLPVQEAEIRARNPRLIFCSITGFGTNCVPAFDNTIQASSGTISQCNGVKPGVSFVDYSAGLIKNF
jgi:crotonobetainyl-CoA:carnitine CoA-transferase CaiB-like acyl-CoA transferase